MPESAQAWRSGRVVLEFSIRRDGSVPNDDPQRLLGSGKEPLDRAAVSAIRSSNPFGSLAARFFPAGNSSALYFPCTILPLDAANQPVSRRRLGRENRSPTSCRQHHSRAIVLLISFSRWHLLFSMTLLPLFRRSSLLSPHRSGKSSLGIFSCQKISVEKCSLAIPRQLYRGFDIGTAKPSSPNVTPFHITCSMFSMRRDSTAGDYRERAIAVLDDLRCDPRLPILTSELVFTCARSWKVSPIFRYARRNSRTSSLFSLSYTARTLAAMLPTWIPCRQSIILPTNKNSFAPSKFFAHAKATHRIPRWPHSA